MVAMRLQEIFAFRYAAILLILSLFLPSLFPSSSHSRYASIEGASDLLPILPLALIIASLALLWAFPKYFLPGKSSKGKISNVVIRKSESTSKFLKHLAKKDSAWDEKNLLKQAVFAYMKMKDSLVSGNYRAMKKFLMPSFYEQLRAFAISRESEGVREFLSAVIVKDARIILAHNYEIKNQDEFTVWILASGRKLSFDESGKAIKGSAKPEIIEEFVSFQRQGRTWLIREVYPASNAAYILHQGNFDQLKTPSKAKKGTSAATISLRAGRALKLLHKLEKSEHHWKVSYIKELVRDVYCQYYLCFEKRDFTPMKKIISGPFYSHMCKIASSMKSSGVRIKAKDLCVRDVEIVLVKNRKGGIGDEFTAWISVHAQVLQLNEEGHVIGGDETLKVFEEYATFIHKDMWCLAELMPPESGESVLSENNFDADNDPPWTDWHYRALPPDKYQ